MQTLPIANRRKRLLALLAGGVVVVAGATVSASASTAASGGAKGAPAAHVHAAKLPRPVAVTVNPSTTAVLVLDLTSVVCTPNPTCVATLPAVAALLANARAAGATVVYSQTTTPGSQILPAVAPQNGDPVVFAHADKFFNTNLDQILSSRGITTLVIVGTAVNGAVLYTTFEANLRGYTAVVAKDGVSATSRYIERYSLFQLLNEPGFPNPTNTPLKTGAVTLTKSNLVTFQP
jgi:nicotinamidase-related amidase